MDLTLLTSEVVLNPPTTTIKEPLRPHGQLQDYYKLLMGYIGLCVTITILRYICLA